MSSGRDSKKQNKKQQGAAMFTTVNELVETTKQQTQAIDNLKSRVEKLEGVEPTEKPSGFVQPKPIPYVPQKKRKSHRGIHLQSTRKRRRRKPMLAYLAVVLLICLIPLGFGGYYLINTYILQNIELDIVEEVPVFQPVLPSPTPSPVPTPSPTPAPVPTPVEPPPPAFVPRDEFLAWREEFNNDDIIGHLRIEGTGIDYLVVQGRDNDFYLYHDIHREPSRAGWIFLDYEVDIRGDDHNMVIYGHNMAENIMFHGIRHFQNYNFLRAHPIISFRTLYADYEWEIFAFYVAHIDFPYTLVNYPNTATWAHWLDNFVYESIHDTGINVTAHDRILTLSTCSGANDDERFVLQARLIR